MSDSVLSKFNSYMADNGQAAFFGFTDCKSGSDLSMYCSSCVNRIMGADLPFRGTAIDLILSGHQPRTFDPILAVEFSGRFSGAIADAKKLIRGARIIL